MSKTKSRGFTLMELLIAVAIFSGLVILALGSFARSLSSSAKVSSVRERTEVTRSIVNQISNDLRYTYKGDVNISGNPGYTIKKGFTVNASADSLELILEYPDSKVALVHKKYYLDNAGTRGTTISMLEDRTSCTKSGICAALNPTSPSDLLPKKYQLLKSSSGHPIFSAISPSTNSRGLVTIDFSFTLTDSGVKAISDCANASIGGRCYSLKTSVVPGGY